MNARLPTPDSRLVIGIFGGTFDPIHYGHLRPVAQVQSAYALAQVRFIPSFLPPHRPPPAANAAQRLRMVELALADYPGFVADDCEMRMGGPSYTVRTLAHLRAEFGATPLCLIIGLDEFLSLDTWHRWQELFELAHVIVMHRPGWERTETARSTPAWAQPRLTADPRRLAGAPAGAVALCAVTPVDISATRIRKAIAAGADVAQDLPPAVWKYIQANHIYISPVAAHTGEERNAS